MQNSANSSPICQGWENLVYMHRPPQEDRGKGGLLTGHKSLDISMSLYKYLQEQTRKEQRNENGYQL